MAKFLLLGKYSLEAMKGISAQRTQEAKKIVEKAGGKVNSIYALLGPYDLALVVELPDDKSAMKVSLELTRMSGIAFTTLPAVDVEEFDKLVG
ncbi:MAG: GYD domain-containing protein [Candidatus Omnitrophica bacterium]|nr:GYD domain-containing protein [Candidatus Omnitrophota bacterium]